jgi:putative flippase GtrA
MDTYFFILPSLISVLILYQLNKLFTYKDKIIGSLGSRKYRLILLVSMLIIYFIMLLKYDKNPMTTPVFWSYFYLVAVPKHLR